MVIALKNRVRRSILAYSESFFKNIDAQNVWVWPLSILTNSELGDKKVEISENIFFRV